MPTLFLIGLIVALLWGANFFWTWEGSRKTRAFDNLAATATAIAIQPIVVAAPAAPVEELPALDEVPASDEVPAIFRQEPVEPVIVVVTATPTIEPTPTPTPYIEYRTQIIYETVEVTPIPMPTLTPTPLALGQVVICVSVAGVKEVYIGDAGMVSGGCFSAVVGPGQTHIPVKVNR